MSNNQPHQSQVSDTFCVMPWIHLHATPAGAAAPCCISESCTTTDGVGNVHTQGLMEIVNSEKMKQLRLDMLAGRKNSECIKCYAHESQGASSFRLSGTASFNHAISDAIAKTNVDGSLDEFNMRYVDVRFSNLCNFKCRTCGQEYSSQWETENLKNNVPYARSMPKKSNTQFFQDVLAQIPYMEIVYFAGGEPLIMEEHYFLLEEMIRQNRTAIQLRYNTNLSKLKFKDKDLLGLWKHFSKPIEVSASIDHCNERAEYIRHGTNWVTVEENFKAIKKVKNVSLQINTVLSVFNVLSMQEFYQYLHQTNMFSPHDHVYSLYPMSSPEHLASHILPVKFKLKGVESLNASAAYLTKHQFKPQHLTPLLDSSKWLTAVNTWEQQKEKFKSEIRRLDAIRGESFERVFPELAPLMDL